MKKIIFENGYDFDVYETEKEAMKRAEYRWNLLTEAEKATTKYFKVYEVEIPEDLDIEEIPMMSDYMIRMIKDFKEE